ncbi:MAG TPA: penicillin-binding transpeptidase domain-containing protein [Longimicrobiales bacterium]|nr:penicillin-binding transpeptidase domain-containing protein [Longimicrobiales bacterium]
MKKISLDTPRRRARFAVTLAAGALALLGLVVFRTQVLREGAEVLVQQGNRLRSLPLPAPRGSIFDRHGVLLAGSDSATALVLMPAPPDSMQARLERLARLLDLPQSWRERAERVARATSRPFVVTTELAPADVVKLAASHRELPGVLLEPWPRRTYPAGPAAEPVVGRVGSATWPPGSGENPIGVDAGRIVGRAGLELAFDSLLAGVAGLRYVEMGPAGSVVTDPTQAPYRTPIRGRVLRTRLDLGLQRHIAELLPTRVRAAAVVLDIPTGDVLALYSNPPNVPGREAQGGDAAGNVPVTDVEPPRAVFQPITAALAMETGHIDLQRPQAIPCRGGMRYGERYFRCWKPDGHGQLALEGAIREACDVYFYQIALRLGLQALLEAGARLGLGAPTGIELPEERPGTFPSDVAELAARLGRAPNPSDALDLATGQGINELTLLRTTHAYAAIANGGGAPAPRLTGAAPADEPRRLELPPERTRDLLAMLDGVTGAGGPAAAAGRMMSGGTRIRGQITRARTQPGAARPTGWFVGVAGDDGQPDRIAIGVLLDRSPSDEAPAALAARIADYYLRIVRDAAAPAAPDTTTASSTTVPTI